ncbi:hypothetical protein [Endozoicomonas ascidiicola]|uniref:hypothetical protein n=1 Tax=Endozoicomonas ascidiicola TaxID=1698521 RepID=UPI00082C44DF|nr:hypothetical protein [Endozoicomonas ascidiicola]
MEIDTEHKLEVKISNVKPLKLTDLTLSLLALSGQYLKFVETETTKDYQISSELLIKEVRSGSVIFELISHAVPLAPLLWEGGPLSEWVKHIEGINNWLLGKQSEKPREIDRKDYEQLNSILEPVAADTGSEMQLVVTGNNNVINQVIINSQEAAAAQNRISREIESLNEPIDHVYRRKVMTWYQTKFDTNSATGDKAKIEFISKKAVKVVFENNEVKESILKGDPRFNKPWQALAYLVDIDVQTINGEPKLYTILRYHPEDTFNPTD